MDDLAVQPRLFGIEHTVTSDDYYTPSWVFERMGLTFDLDVCAPPGGIEWIPATDHYSIEDDALVQPWYGRIWMNPPFSASGDWVDRFIDHRHGVCLLPHSRARWHSRLWASDAALVDPNRTDAPSMFKFMRHGVEENIYMPVFLAAFGDECVEAIARLGRVR